MSLTITENIFVRFGGHSPRTASQSTHEEREPVVKLGLAVAFSALFSAINWGMAGFTFTADHGVEARIATAVMAGVISFLLVSVLDATFLYLSDTTEASWMLKTPYGLIRLAIILLVSAITSQAVIPVLLRPELEAHALKLTETAEGNRTRNLAEQFKVGDKQAAIDKAVNEVDKLEDRIRIIPKDIQQRFEASKRCWSSYYNKKQSLLNTDYTAKEVKDMLSGKAATCSREEKTAKAMQEEYLEDIRTQLTSAREAKKEAVKEFHAVKEDIGKRIKNGRAIEEKAFSPASATVLASLLESDRGARIKYALVTIFLLVLECLPLILKLICGRTPLGEMVFAGRKEAKRRRAFVMAENEHERRIAEGVLAASQDACLHVLNSAEGRAYFGKVFASYMLAIAPTEAVIRMMREIERQEADVNVFTRRYPRYGTVIAEAWARAIQETTQILQAASVTR